MFRLVLIGLILVTTLQADWRPPPGQLERHLDRLTESLRFDLFRWELAAVSAKLGDFLDNPAGGLTPEQEKVAVLSYLDASRQVGELEGQIERVYADPTQSDPAGATKAMREQLAGLQQQMSAQAPAVEAILEQQLSRQIDAAGLDTTGIVWPPTRFSFTDPPKLLVVSPRDRIQRLRTVDLKADLDPATRDQLEHAVETNTDMAAYVTNIGGYGAYPTIVVNRHGLGWTLETIAHEWIHNYLSFHKLGWAFLEGGDAVTINETVASIAGEELGLAIMAAYYPEFLPPPPDPANETAEPMPPADPPSFDFNQEMRETRVTVDALLEQGRVEEAEAYMEERRQMFVENGYRLRVLNQAYFAFHGSYATGPAATDPIGPKLERLRALSLSLADFLDMVDGITTEAEIDALLQQLEGEV